MKKFLWIAVLVCGACTVGYAQMPVNFSGTIKRIDSFASSYVVARTIVVWLPESYDSTKKYPVLYMHDGQNLFDSTVTWNHEEWKVDETITRLIRENKIRPCIVVGIWNTGDTRWNEYFPQKAVNYYSSQNMNTFSTTYLKNPLLADNYLKFLVKELKPFIDKSFPTLSDRDNTFIAGSSMGGLISLYAMCEYPKVFGGAACISTHWIGGWPPPVDYIPNGFYQYLKDKSPSPKSHRIYFDYGTETLDVHYKTYQLEVDKIMVAKGYTSSTWITKEFVGADHSEKSWKKRFYIPIEFLLGN
jgi:enterochelin esterase-like enzyme